MSASHKGLRISSCGFFVSVEQPFLGASPDALINCTCCGQGTIDIKRPFSVPVKHHFRKQLTEESTSALMNFLMESFSCAVTMGIIISAKYKCL